MESLFIIRHFERECDVIMTFKPHGTQSRLQRPKIIRNSVCALVGSGLHWNLGVIM